MGSQSGSALNLKSLYIDVSLLFCVVFFYCVVWAFWTISPNVDHPWSFSESTGEEAVSALH